jgi:hypothetical protein
VDDFRLVRRAASQIITVRGSSSPAYIADRLENARRVGDQFSVGVWQDISKAVNEILRADRAPEERAITVRSRGRN